MNDGHLLRALILAIVLFGASVAACTQGPGGAATDAPPASPTPAAASEAPGASPSSSGAKGDYDY
jgi:hypothetical protein